MQRLARTSTLASGPLVRVRPLVSATLPTASTALHLLRTSSSSSRLVPPVTPSASVNATGRGCPPLALARRHFAAAASPSTSSSSPTSSSSSSSSSSPPPTGSSWLEKAKAVWAQYWGGTKQLWRDAREMRAIRRRLMRDIATQGAGQLSRREARFVRRVRDDLRALAPFLAFFSLPFSAYALPLIVRFFPGFLPSTYHSPSYRIEQMRKRQQAKTQAARAVRGALAERLRGMDVPAGGPRDALLSIVVAPLSETDPSTLQVTLDPAVLRELRPLDAFVTTCLKLDDLNPPTASSPWTLAGLSDRLWLCPPELRALCRFYGLSTLPFPTYDHCLEQLRERVALIRHDDQLLVQEGERWVAELSDEELLEACDERGLPTAHGPCGQKAVPREELVAQLQRWLDFTQPPPPVSRELTLLAPALALNSPFKSK